MGFCVTRWALLQGLSLTYLPGVRGSGPFKSLLMFQESHDYVRGIHLPSSYPTWDMRLFLHVFLNKMENQFIKEESQTASTQTSFRE